MTVGRQATRKKARLIAQLDADVKKWAIAKELSERNEAGQSVPELAEETGRPEHLIREWIAMYRQYGDALVDLLPAFQIVRALTELGRKGRERRTGR